MREWFLLWALGFGLLWGLVELIAWLRKQHGWPQELGFKARIDLQVRREFDRLSAKYENFLVRRLGDTHAKILVKDREFFVVTRRPEATA